MYAAATFAMMRASGNVPVISFRNCYFNLGLLSFSFDPLCSKSFPSSVYAAIDCELTEWSQWSECNKSCGKGHMIRTRMIKMEPQFGGAPCPETVQRKKCRIRKCLRNPNIEKRRWKEPREKRRTEQAKEDVDGEPFPGMCRAWNTCATAHLVGRRSRLVCATQDDPTYPCFPEPLKDPWTTTGELPDISCFKYIWPAPVQGQPKMCSGADAASVVCYESARDQEATEKHVKKLYACLPCQTLVPYGPTTPALLQQTNISCRCSPPHNVAACTCFISGPALL